ncbi:MAG: oligosaccharide flippase family protein [Paludibacter sp.]
MKIKPENLKKILQNFRQKGFFNLLSANMLIQVVAFAAQLFVAGILFPDDIGRIKIIQTYLSIFSIVAGMGFSASTLKLCSENRSKEEQTSLFRSAFFFTLISTICLYIIILILNIFSIFTSDKLIQWLIPLGLFPIISNSLFMVFVSYFQATKKIKLIANLTISNKLIAISAIIILSYFWGIKGYYLAYNLSFILMLIVCFQLFRSTITKDFYQPLNKSLFSVHWNYAKPSMLANLLSESSVYMDILLLSFFIHDMNEIGYYSFAITLTVLLRILPSTVQQISIPYLSTLSSKKNDFIIVFKRYNKMLYVVVGVTLIIALISIPYLIHWVFGGKYDQSMPYFTLLAVGWSIRQLTQLQSAAIFSLGKINFSVYISLISLAFNIVLYSIALNFFGLLGAAYASILSGTVILLSSRYFYLKAQREML